MESGARANEARHGVHLDIAAYGDISSLFWAHNPAPPAEHVVCDVAFGETPYSLCLVLLEVLGTSFTCSVSTYIQSARQRHLCGLRRS